MRLNLGEITMDYVREKRSTTKGCMAKATFVNLTIFLLFFCSQAHALSWSPPQAIISDLPTPVSLYTTRIAADADGNWHTVYDSMSGSNYYINYITSSEGPYVVAQADQTIEVIMTPDIDVDPNGGVHISYLRVRDGQFSVMYTNNLSGSWSPPQAIISDLPTPVSLYTTRIAADADGNWHTVYDGYSCTGGTCTYYIYYLTNNGGPYAVAQATYDTQTGEGECIYSPDIDVSPNGGVHISYLRVQGEQLSVMYTNNLSGSWSSPQAIIPDLPTPVSLFTTWIAADVDDNWYIVYDSMHDGNFYINYITNSGGPYIVAQTDQMIETIMTPDIDVDSHGGVHISYLRARGEQLSVMYTTTAFKTYVLSVGVNWGSGLRGDLDADNLSVILDAAMPSVIERNQLHLDPSVSDGSNLASFGSAFNALLSQVRSGDTIIISFASHGESHVQGDEPPFNTNLAPHPLGYGHGPMEMRTGDEYTLLADEDDPNDNSDRLYDDALKNFLSDSRLATVRKILIFDSCRSGGFGPDLTESISNIAVLAGCNEGYFTFSSLDGTGIFTNTIIDGLTQGPDGFPKADGADGSGKDGTVTLDELDAFIEAFDFGDLIGMELPLRYLTGTGIFIGVDADITASVDFVGGFEGLFPGDLDNDKGVDMKDFSSFATHWLDIDCSLPGWCERADINWDSKVDIKDLSILALHWLEGVGP